MAKGIRSTPLLLIFLLTLTLTLLFLFQGGYLRPAESLLLRVVAPVEGVFAGAVSGVGTLARDMRDLRALQARYALLEKQATELLIENILLEEVQAENQELRRLLSFAQANPDMVYRGASVRGRVIGQEPTNLARYIIVDIGEQQGIRRNMPVITQAGLVGTVDRVYPTASKVRLINDLNHTVNVILQRSRTSAVARGQVDGNLLVEWLPQDPEAVAVGDIVLTSGLGGRFPRLLVVGQVVETRQRDYETFQSAIVRPVVDFEHLEFVLIVTDFSPLEGLEQVFSGDEPGAETPGQGE